MDDRASAPYMDLSLTPGHGGYWFGGTKANTRIVDLAGFVGSDAGHRLLLDTCRPKRSRGCFDVWNIMWTLRKGQNTKQAVRGEEDCWKM